MMTLEGLEKYKQVQSIAKETMEFLKLFIKQGLSAKDIKSAAEDFMIKKGVESFWYYGIGAFVFAGELTTIFVSGRDYQPSLLF